MTRNLKRFYGQGDLHFITFSCYQRRPLLHTPQSRDIFISSLEVIRARHRFLLVGYVVMPEHIHFLISEPPLASPSVVLESLKHHVWQCLHSPPRLWDHRFYDFNVYSAHRRRQKLDYMHMNPWKRRLVKHPADWRWSSFLNYQTGKTGMINRLCLTVAKVIFTAPTTCLCARLLCGCPTRRSCAWGGKISRT